MSDYKYSLKQNVNKIFTKFKEISALKDFNIQIQKGTIHGLLGLMELENQHL